ncbi:MAG: hypothetical protein HQL16_01410 [Candidatus Omnitrophica bacterium]|nr:hypothetical protein [Candidatus Omnitrophota bacterium]
MTTSQNNNFSGGDDLLNRRECPHCGLWYRMDEAKPAGENAVRCPNCDWKVENA